MTDPQPRIRQKGTLPEDGILDPIAIELAVRGARRVALTPAERLTATARILASGGTPYQVSVRLHVSGSTALALAARLQPHLHDHAHQAVA